MSGTVLVSIVGIIGALVGTLGSQCIAARNALKMKKIELVYGRKVDAYKLLLEKAGEFNAAPKDDQKYSIFQSALHAALIVASNEVSDALDNPRKNSLQLNAINLRSADTEYDIQRIQVDAWYRAMEAVKNAMRADVGELFR